MNSPKPLVIPIFIPHSGCPHQCAFCNQSIITEKNRRYIIPSDEEIQKVVEEFLAYRGKREEVQLAFFGGNFLGLQPDEITLLLSSAQRLADRGKIDSVRFSTRPDTITKERLELIAPYPVSTIEIGVQSMSDQVLKMARRGHTAEDTIKAVRILKEFDRSGLYTKSSVKNLTTTHSNGQIGKKFITGMQMMVGLPSEYADNIAGCDKARFTDNIDEVQFKDGIEAAQFKYDILTAQKIAEFKPDFVRIYPLIVLEGSLIARWYRAGRYKPISLDECVQLVKKIFLIFQRHNIPVIRMGLQASDLLQDKLSMVAGPWHPAFGHLVYSEIFFDKTVDSVEKVLSSKNLISHDLNHDLNNKTKHNCHIQIENQSKSIIEAETNSITLTVNPASISRVRGDKNRNIERLREIYPSVEFKIKADKSLDTNFIKIE